MKEYRERIKSILSEIEYGYIGYGNMHGDGDQGLNIIQDALKRMLPRKAVLKLHTNRVPGEQEEYYCPTCDEWLTWGGFKPKHCMECGQSIEY